MLRVHRLNKPRKYLIISVKNEKQGTGSDFYLELADYVKEYGFSCFNTLKFGHFLLFFYELFLLFYIPPKSRVLTTWPGFPRQLLVLNGFSNRTRFKLAGFTGKLKKWDLTLLPIDLPLMQFHFKLRNGFVVSQSKRELDYFCYFKTFLTCGYKMTAYFHEVNSLCGERNIVPFDFYCQNLPGNPERFIKNRDHDIVKIAISGNLTRMTDDLDVLPEKQRLQYYFTGPGGDSIQNLVRRDFMYLGLLDENVLIDTLAQFKFGLIFYSQEQSDYFSWVIAGKLTTYLLAGLPIICHSTYTSMAELISRERLGIVISSYHEIEKLTELGANEYNTMVNNCLKVAAKLRSGDVYKEALVKAQLI